MKQFQRPINVLDSEVLQCSYGNYPWDDWEKKALAKGVPKELAALGRLTMREAYQHDWEDRLKSLCGWYDQGRCMIRLALRSPKWPANAGSGCSTRMVIGGSMTRRPGSGNHGHERRSSQA